MARENKAMGRIGPRSRLASPTQLSPGGGVAGDNSLVECVCFARQGGSCWERRRGNRSPFFQDVERGRQEADVSRGMCPQQWSFVPVYSTCLSAATHHTLALYNKSPCPVVPGGGCCRFWWGRGPQPSGGTGCEDSRQGVRVWAPLAKCQMKKPRAVSWL